MKLDRSRDTVSVIIPAFNVENSLRQCIESVLKQSFQAFEIFVINDGSQDNTREVAKSFGSQIIYLEQMNQGAGAARNAGIEKATGNFFAFLDADDYWLPDFLKECVEFLLLHKDAVALLTGWCLKTSEQNKVIVPPIMHSSKHLEPIVLENFFQFWAEQDFVQTGAIMIRAQTARQAGLQRPDLRNSQDWEYWALIATYGKWGFLPKVLYVNNSHIAARGKWQKKYQVRRKLCPTVESWESRIKHRLKVKDRAAFEVIRGRVAAGYAHLKILAGNYKEAYQIAIKYGRSMPHNRLTSLMILGTKLRYPGWLVVCLIARFKESLKN